MKQPNLAIDAAIAANTPIDVIGGSFVDDPTYLENIRKKCEMSGGLATLHLDASHEDKIRMVGKAKACLVPSNFSEPYGLVATEALCCGTPVIATDDGALSEIVLPKVGIICAGNAAFVDVVQGFEGDRFEPKDCRERAEYFSREKMAERYLKLYREVIKGPGW